MPVDEPWVKPDVFVSASVISGAVTVLETPHGYIFGAYGGIPINILGKLVRAFGSKRALMDVGLANYYSRGSGMVCFCIVEDEASTREWHQKVECYLDTLPISPEDRWYRGLDTGISSCTIFYVMTGRQPPYHWSPATPQDAADFGRCSRLLARFPEWACLLGKVALKYSEWRGLVHEWDKLEALYAAGSNEALTARIQELTQHS